MKRIGLLGGMSLESTLSYITGLRDGVRERLPPCLCLTPRGFTSKKGFSSL